MLIDAQNRLIKLWEAELSLHPGHELRALVQFHIAELQVSAELKISSPTHFEKWNLTESKGHREDGFSKSSQNYETWIWHIDALSCMWNMSRLPQWHDETIKVHRDIRPIWYSSTKFTNCTIRRMQVIEFLLLNHPTLIYLLIFASWN